MQERGATKPDGVYVALLRGINIGGRRLPMKDLAAMFVDAGCSHVTTYIQSGNVVFQANPAMAKRIPPRVAAAIKQRFGFDVPVVTRTDAELHDVARGNPFVPEGADPETLHVAFLVETPDAARIALLDCDRSPPDKFVVRGREIFLHCPNGVARTKLTNGYFDTKLGTVSTMRNWRTVLKLLELAGA
jgi:uncharacterized protein (DUF1697 family)